MEEEMDGEVFISRHSRHFSFINNMIKVLFPIVPWIAVETKTFRAKETEQIGETKVLLLLYKIASFWFCTTLDKLFCFVEIFSLIIEENNIFDTNKI